jgi:hypothetical protein
MSAKQLAAAILLAGAAILAVAAPAHADQTLQQRCDAEKWPQKVPNAVGKDLVADIVTAPLPPVTDTDADDWFWICVNNIDAIAPDGHDVTNDKGPWTRAWRITGQSPPAGTLVPENQTVTLTVVP